MRIGEILERQLAALRAGQRLTAAIDFYDRALLARRHGDVDVVITLEQNGDRETREAFIILRGLIDGESAAADIASAGS